MDKYKYHKLALKPFFNEEPSALVAISSLSFPEKEALFASIHKNGLGPLWHQLLKRNSAISVFRDELVERLGQIAMGAAAQYLVQKYVLERLVDIFAKESIVYAIFKGGHLREILYEPPMLRPASDIDILVHLSDRDEVICELVSAGFTLEVKQQNASHEATLVSHNVAVDLHWHLLRPGRLRTTVTDEFLARRQDYGSHFGFDVETTLFVMLVHPVFNKYSTTSIATMVRFVDLLEWLKRHTINWNDLLAMLQKSGVCTAAWITVLYFQKVTDGRVPKHFLTQIQPSPLKKYYLKKWIRSDWASKLSSYPLLVQIGFTLPAHDTLLDVLRFVRTLLHERKKSKVKKEAILAARNHLEK